MAPSIDGCIVNQKRQIRAIFFLTRSRHLICADETFLRSWLGIIAQEMSAQARDPIPTRRSPLSPSTVAMITSTAMATSKITTRGIFSKFLNSYDAHASSALALRATHGSALQSVSPLRSVGLTLGLYTLFGLTFLFGLTLYLLRLTLYMFRLTLLFGLALLLGLTLLFGLVLSLGLTLHLYTRSLFGFYILL